MSFVTLLPRDGGVGVGVVVYVCVSRVGWALVWLRIYLLPVVLSQRHAHEFDDTPASGSSYLRFHPFCSSALPFCLYLSFFPLCLSCDQVEMRLRQLEGGARLLEAAPKTPTQVRFFFFCRHRARSWLDGEQLILRAMPPRRSFLTRVFFSLYTLHDPQHRVLACRLGVTAM